MTEDPNSHPEREPRLDDNNVQSGRGFPMLAPTIIVAVAALILLVVWLVL